MKKQYIAPELTITTIQTTILAASGGETNEIGISNSGVNGAQALSFRTGWGVWNDDDECE